MKKILSMILALALCLSLVGCGSAEAAGGAAAGGRSSGTVIAATAAVSEADLLAAEAEAEEDVETTVTVTLSDGASRADGAGVTVSGSTVTITAGGSYRVTGTLTNGQIVVNAPEEKVVLALDGASVTCENSAALYVVKAKKVILSLVSGSENSLASTGEYIQTDDNTVDAAIFSKDDLMIKGSGALAVSSETGHGIVSNGDLTITGGEIYVSGPTSDGDGALDYAGTGTITGGTIVAAGSSGMAQSLSSDTQGVVLLTLSGTQSAGSAVTLTDADGAVLASFTPEKAHSSVVISAPGMKSGGTYTVVCGSESRSVTLEGFTYSEGGFGDFGGGRPGGMGGGFGGDRPDGGFDGDRPDGDFSGERPDGTPPSGFDGSKPNGAPPAGFSGGSGGQGQRA